MGAEKCTDKGEGRIERNEGEKASKNIPKKKH